MTKTVLLSGGPEDGKIVTIKEDKTSFTVIQHLAPIAPDGSIQVGCRTGIYEQFEDRPGQQVFQWVGWL